MSVEGQLPRANIERLAVIAILITVAALSWIYVLIGADMSLMMAMTGAPLDSGAWLNVAAVVFAWSAMMLAMMLPSATPMLLFFHMTLQRRAAANAWMSMSVFALGYLVTWIGFSAAATAVQLGLDRLRLLSPAMAIASPLAVGGLILISGLYQFTASKHGCLRHCASPLDFIIKHWRSGSNGAFIMGLRHGSYCLGCCWALMALLFAGGMMNLAWIGGLSLYVLVEKALPAHNLPRLASGLALVLWGTMTIWRAIAAA